MLSLHMIYLLVLIIYASTNAQPSCLVQLIQNAQNSCTTTNIDVYQPIPNNDWAKWVKLAVDVEGALPIPGLSTISTMTDFLIDSVTATDQNKIDLAFQAAINAEFTQLKECMDAKIINKIEENEQRDVTAVAFEFQQLKSIFSNAVATTFHAQYLLLVHHLLDLVLKNFALDSQFDTLERFFYYLPLFKATALLYDQIITGFLLYLKLNNHNQDFIAYYTLAHEDVAMLSLWIETAHLDISNLYTNVELIFPTEEAFGFNSDEAKLEIINSTSREQIIQECRTTLPDEPTACQLKGSHIDIACWIREGNMLYDGSFADWSTNFTNIYYHSTSVIHNKLSDIRATECQIFGDNFGFESVSSGGYYLALDEMVFVSNNTNDTSHVFNEFNISGGSIVHSSGACLEYNYKSGYVFAQSCDETNIYQKWLFTTNGTIKTVFNDKCIENSDQNSTRCNLPKVTGNCGAATPRFYYNSNTNSCKLFTYGGCGGNGNNFATLMKCRAACEDVETSNNLNVVVKDCTGKDNQKWLKKCCFKYHSVCYF